MDTQETIQVCYDKEAQLEDIDLSQTYIYNASTSEVSGTDWNFKHTNMLQSYRCHLERYGN
jgi:hypothetical protein